MIEKFLFWAVIKAFYVLKNKFPNGKIKNIELIEIDKLTGELKNQFKQLDIYTSQEADDDLINSINVTVSDLLTKIKTTLKKR